MGIKKYRAFLTAIETQSLTKTADILGYTQPGISHMITSLGQELGFPLLSRTKDGVFPTDNAKELLYYMKQIVAAEDTLQSIAHKICGIESGTLRVGSFRSVSIQWLPTIISTFLSQHVNIDLQILEGTQGELSEWLLNGSIDLAFTSEPVPENFDFIPLWNDRILAVISKSHPLAEDAMVNPRDLSQYPFIVPNEGADETVWQVMNTEGLIPNIKFRIKGDMITLAMIGQNLGVSLIPELMLTDQPDTIVAKPLTGNYYRMLGICIRSEKYISPAAKAFISLTKKFMANVWEECAR